ncbi:MAG: class I SAM-dependent methyltransferase [Balneolaceae bacterium]|nr:MAG: class I SAM-dependent methyltransferase [Balneolaceae bacterium]
MSRIAYDPVKDSFAGMIRGRRWLRTLFYKLLNLFFLRSWHVRSMVRHLHAINFSGYKKWNVLDAGSGFGQYNRFLLDEFDNAVIRAVDVKESYLEDCRSYFAGDIKNGRITFENLDLLKLSIREKYDFVLCVDVMEHIKNDTAVLGNISRSLKDGGYFLMHSPSHRSGEDAAEGEGSFVDEHARTGYSRNDIETKLRKTGLIPVEINYTYRKWGHASWIIMIKWPMLMLNRLGMGAAILLPFYYLIFLIPGLIMMNADLTKSKEEGNGIIVLAQKG